MRHADWHKHGNFHCVVIYYDHHDNMEIRQNFTLHELFQKRMQ
jgi:hypothetical protein